MLYSGRDGIVWESRLDKNSVCRLFIGFTERREVNGCNELHTPLKETVDRIGICIIHLEK